MTPYPSCIKHKIDWITIMYENMTPWEVFQSLGINRLCNEEVYEAFNRRYFLQNYDSHVAIDFKFGTMHVRAVDVFSRCNACSTVDVKPNDFFFTEFPHIRFDISGQKLDALRDEGIDINQLVFNPLQIPDREYCRYHYTRCDFAFDFLNYQPDFMIQLEQLIYDVGNPYTCRVPTGVPGGLKYNIHKGANGFTIYLGAGKSTKLLRCYDKMFQYRNDLSCVPYFEDQPDGRQYPFSWMRMELQTRREQAEAVISQSSGDWMSIFKYIYDNFAIMQSQGSTQVSVLWQSLFNFQNIRSIIQNANFV